MLGEHRKATVAAERAAAQYNASESDWPTQHIGLAIADVLLLAGRFREAAALASETLTRTSRAPLSIGDIGRVTRWEFRISQAVGATEALERLETIAGECEKYDLFDQGEVLGILVEGQRQAGLDYHGARERLEGVLKLLPEATNLQLLRLGARS